ncbi:MAG: hypothetical protein M3451_01555 [Chloroflexota bacterium]|nr:hypothetical protein [Chloroflexota bacterium]
MVVRATVLCYLGEVARSVVVATEQAIGARSPQAKRLVSSFGLLESDLKCDTGSPEEVIACFAEREDRFAGELSAALDRVTSLEARTALRQQGVEIGPEILLIIISPMGTRMALPLLFGAARSYLGSIAREHSQLPIRKHGLFLSPGLLSLPRDEYEGAEARAYAMLKELERWGTHPGTLSWTEQFPFDFHWLTDRRNDAGETVGDMEAALPALSGGLASLSLDGLFQQANASLRLHLLAEPHGRRAQYSSFGFAQLIFDRDRLARYLTARVGEDALRSQPLNDELPLDPGLVSLDVREWVRGQHLLDARRRIEEREGIPIWKPFTFRALRNDESARSYALDVERAGRRWEHEQLEQFLRGVTHNRRALMEQTTRAAEARLSEEVDRNGLRAADAWVKLLLGEHSPYLGEGNYERDLDLPSIENSVRKEVEQFLGVAAPREKLRDLERELQEQQERLGAGEAQFGELRDAFQERKAELRTRAAEIAAATAEAESPGEPTWQVPYPADPDPEVDAGSEEAAPLPELEADFVKCKNALPQKEQQIEDAAAREKRDQLLLITAPLAVGGVAGGLFALAGGALGTVAVSGAVGAATGAAAALSVRRRGTPAGGAQALREEHRALEERYHDLKARIERARAALVQSTMGAAPGRSSISSPAAFAGPEVDLELQDLAVRMQGQAETVEEIRSRLRALAIERDTVRRDVVRIDRQITDPSERRRVLEKRVEEARSAVAEAATGIGNQEDELKAAEREYRRLRDERRTFLTQSLIVYPLALGAVVAAISALLVWGGWTTTSMLLAQGWRLRWVAATVAFIYACAVGWRYFTGVAPAIAEGRRRIRHLEADLRARLQGLPDRWNAIFVQRFSGYTLDEMLSWIGGLRKQIAALSSRLEDVHSRLRELHEIYAEDGRTIQPVGELFVRDVFRRIDYERIYASDHEARELLTSFFATPRPRVSSLLSGGKLDALEDAVEEFAQTRWGVWLGHSVEDALRTAAASDVVPSDQVTALFEAAAPLVELTRGEGSGEDLIGRVDLVGVAHETSRVAEMLQDLGHHPQEVITGDETRITYCRVAHGFPAYRLACVRPWQKHYLAAVEPMHTRASMSASPDPLPSAVEFGYTWDPIRQTTAPALVFGHIVRDEDGYHHSAGPLGRDRRELYSTLRDFRYQEQLQAIAAAVAADLAAPDARERMGEFLAGCGGELDEVETEIVRDLCAQRSPL